MCVCLHGCIHEGGRVGKKGKEAMQLDALPSLLGGHGAVHRVVNLGALLKLLEVLDEEVGEVVGSLVVPAHTRTQAQGGG